MPTSAGALDVAPRPNVGAGVSACRGGFGRLSLLPPGVFTNVQEDLWVSSVFLGQASSYPGGLGIAAADGR